MSLRIKLALLLVNLILMITAGMNGQNKHTVTIEDQILISPSKFNLKIICASSSILSQQWMEGECSISKDSILNILDGIENANIAESPKESIDKSLQEYLDVLYVDAIGIKPYQEVKERLYLKAMVMVEEYHVDDFGQHESSLIDKMIEDAKLIATEGLAKHGKELKNILYFKEMNEDTNADVEMEHRSGFSFLKEKFIEANYQGHQINELGQIVLRKKIQVFFEIE